MEGPNAYQPAHHSVPMQGYPVNPQGQAGIADNATGLRGGPSNRLNTPDSQPHGYGLRNQTGELQSGSDMAALKGSVRDVSQKYIYGVPSFSH